MCVHYRAQAQHTFWNVMPGPHVLNWFNENDWIRKKPKHENVIAVIHLNIFVISLRSPCRRRWWLYVLTRAIQAESESNDFHAQFDWLRNNDVCYSCVYVTEVGIRFFASARWMNAYAKQMQSQKWHRTFPRMTMSALVNSFFYFLYTKTEFIRYQRSCTSADGFYFGWNCFFFFLESIRLRE